MTRIIPRKIPLLLSK